MDVQERKGNQKHPNNHDEAYESNISCDTQLNVISSLASKMSGGLNQMSSRAHNTRSNNQPPSTPTSDRIVYV